MLTTDAMSLVFFSRASIATYTHTFEDFIRKQQSTVNLTIITAGVIVPQWLRAQTVPDE